MMEMFYALTSSLYLASGLSETCIQVSRPALPWDPEKALSAQDCYLTKHLAEAMLETGFHWNKTASHITFNWSFKNPYCARPEIHKVPLHACSPHKCESPPSGNGSSAHRAKRAQRMQASINVIAAFGAVVDSLSKDTQEISQGLSPLEISNVPHTAGCCAQITSPHVDSTLIPVRKHISQ